MEKFKQNKSIFTTHAIFIVLSCAVSRQNEFQVWQKKEGKTLERRLCKYYVNWMLLM